MTSSLAVTNHFEGTTISTLVYLGRPVWIARDIGVALGYTQRGKRLASKITGDWADEFIDGVDYQILGSAELSGLREKVVDIDERELKGTESVPLENQRGLLVLFEPGLYLALVKTRKPIGRRLRRFFAQEVMPQLARTGRYLPDGNLLQSSVATSLALYSNSEPLPGYEPTRLEQAAALCNFLANAERKGMLSPEVKTAYQLLVTQLALNTNLAPLMPVVEDVWLSPTEIAERFSITPQRLGRLITALGIRGKEGFSRKIINKAKGHARSVESYLYCPRAVELLRQSLESACRPIPEDTPEETKTLSTDDVEGES